jgi:hypothetical protein
MSRKADPDGPAKVKCPTCGESFDPRGLPGHVRSVHDRGLGRSWPR